MAVATLAAAHVSTHLMDARRARGCCSHQTLRRTRRALNSLRIVNATRFHVAVGPSGLREIQVKNGVTQEEIIETITHLAFYVGCPSAMSTVTRAKALFAKKEAP